MFLVELPAQCPQLSSLGDATTESWPQVRYDTLTDTEHFAGTAHLGAVVARPIAACGWADADGPEPSSVCREHPYSAEIGPDGPRGGVDGRNSSRSCGAHVRTPVVTRETSEINMPYRVVTRQL